MDRGISRVSANDLTSPKNSKMVSDILTIKPADLIRCNGGKHIVVIIGHTTSGFFCAHSHDQTEELGVHNFMIDITDPKKDIFHQEWNEKMRDGSNFQAEVLEGFKDGDGIWRLTLIDGLYQNVKISQE